MKKHLRISLLFISFFIYNSFFSQSVCMRVPYEKVYNTSGNHRYIMSGDLNNDGKEDILSMSYNLNVGIVDVFLCNSTSPFSAPTTYTIAANADPRSSKLGDFNNDGNLDLVTIFQFNSFFTIRYGNGLGAFTGTTTISIPFSGTAQSLDLADINIDGKLDILIGGSNSIGYQNNGGGSFSQNFINGWGPGSVVGDFTSDGFPDFITLVSGNFYLSKGSGSFFYPSFALNVYAVSPLMTAISSEDFNGDGNLDIIGLENSTVYGKTYFFKGSGAATFSQTFSQEMGSAVNAPLFSDLNNDGKKDAVFLQTGGKYQILMNLGSGVFGNRVLYSTANGGPGMAIFDTNGDGLKEIMISLKSSNQFMINPCSAAGNLKLPNIITHRQLNWINVGGLRVRDVNNDGRNDVCVMSPDSMAVFLNSLNGYYSAKVFVLRSPQFFEMPDINNDGLPDVVTVNTNDSSSAYLNTGSGNFSYISTFAVGNNTKRVACGDLNSDGKIDLVFSTANNNSIRSYLGNGSGGFTSIGNSSVPGGNFPNDMDLADINGDFIPDIVIGKLGGWTTTMLGTGSGLFTSPTTYTAASFFSAGVVFKDLNNDGLQDIAGINSSSLTVLLATGPNTFSIASVYPTNTASGIVAKDMNMDGNADLVVSGYTGYSIFAGSGMGALSATSYPLNGFNISTSSPQAEDINGDLTPDVITTANYNDNAIVISLNNTAYVPPVSTLTMCTGGSVTLSGPSGATNYTWFPGNVTGNPLVVNTPGSYYFTTTSGTCSSTSGTITVVTSTNTAPSVSITPSSAAACSGQTITLAASGASSYTWNTSATSSSITVSPSANSTYSVIGVAANGCSNSAISTVSVSNGSLNIAGPNTMCQGSSVSQIATGAVTYTWNTGANTNSIIVNPGVTTVYTVSGTDALGCIVSSVKSLSVIPSVTVTGIPTSACHNSTICMNASSASSYAWSGTCGYNSTQQNICLVVTQSCPGNFTLTSNTAGCTYTNAISFPVYLPPNVFANSSGLACAGQSATLTAYNAASYSWNTSATGSVAVVSPTATTVYTVLGTSNGCTAQATVTQSVSTSPPPTLTLTGPPTLCQGTSTTISASGANSYTWSTGTVWFYTPINPTVTTTYSVAGTATTGCTGTAMMTVSVIPVPNLSVTGVPSTACWPSMMCLTGSGATTYTWINNCGALGTQANTCHTVSPSCPQYTLTGSNAGCTSTKFFTVSIVPSSTIMSTAATSSVVCAGQPATLTATGANSYTWSNSSVSNSLVVSPTTTSMYFVNGTDPSGCIGTNSLALNVNPLPSVTAASSASWICVGQTATLSASGANTYTWSTSSLSSTIAVSPTVNTTYTVTGTDVNGCVNTSAFTQGVSACTGFTETLINTGAIEVFPNPNNGSFIIRTNLHDAVADLYSGIGEKIFSASITNETLVQLNMAPGIYFLTVRNSEQSTTLKLIRQ